MQNTTIPETSGLESFTQEEIDVYNRNLKKFGENLHEDEKKLFTVLLSQSASITKEIPINLGEKKVEDVTSLTLSELFENSSSNITAGWRRAPT